MSKSNEVAFFDAFPVYNDESIESITHDDVLDLIRSNENLMFLDTYTKLSEENLKAKIKMIKKINSIYHTRESFDNLTESREGVIGAAVKLFVESIKFIVRIIVMIIKTIAKLFVKLVTFPFKALSKELIYRTYMQRKKARARESYDYSIERELDPHRPTKPMGPQAGSDKEIADINKFLDFHVEHDIVERCIKSDNPDAKNIFNASFKKSEEAIDIKSMRTIGSNICKAFDTVNGDINRYITDSAHNSDRGHEDNQHIQNESNNLNRELNSMNLKIFEGVDITPKNWTNQVTCARRIVDCMVNPKFVDIIGKFFGEIGNILKSKRGSMEQQQKTLEGIIKKAESNPNVDKSTVESARGISKGIGRVNDVFMCFSNICRTFVTCYSKFKENEGDYKQRSAVNKKY